MGNKMNQEVVTQAVNAIRMMAVDGTRKANSGHPGMPMGMADCAFVLWTQFLRYNPKDPEWSNRDRFVLSAGHGSMLLYTMLYLSGYDVTINDLKNFRQWESRTPGHPEYGCLPGVETTTGPLGQGFANGVGMAIASKIFMGQFNKAKSKIIDHHIYSIVSDGDLMEGVACEAASLAGHLQWEISSLFMMIIPLPLKAKPNWLFPRMWPSGFNLMGGTLLKLTGIITMKLPVLSNRVSKKITVLH